ncbi:MAG: amino acid permease [Veillonella sp.]|uniref:amino acid permease n=1 Tax=Veillonella sp. TaxID=1926307 RepID=UPI00290FCC8B|nr:amino acid permease [Veillonella sp.]MDU3383908.1 amino acid permease [Veillonella sp.]
MSDTHQLKRGLKNRHVQLLAIGGAIGTGLFLGSGRAIHLAGPSIIFAYLITGVMCFFIMRALGELLLSNLNHHSFIDFVEDYLGDRAAFITGWTYWFCWLSLAMADLTAVGLYMQYWIPWLPQWIPALLVLIVLLLMNLTAVKHFGEMEFWFALIKVIAIISLIIIGIIMIVTGFTTDAGVAAFSNMWNYGGWNNIPLRIILFYVGSLAIIMSIYPWTAVNPAASPFVAVFTAVGITAAAGIVNFVVLTSAASATNSGIFSTGRMIYALAKRGHAPSSMRRLTHSSVPYQATIFSAAVLLITVVLNYVMPEAVFVMITSISTFCFIFIWAMMVICHLKYRKKNPDVVAQSKFKMPLYPVMNYVILAFFVFVLAILALNEDTRIALLFTPIWFIILWAFYSMLNTDDEDALGEELIEMAGVKELYKKPKKDDSDDYVI